MPVDGPHGRLVGQRHSEARLLRRRTRHGTRGGRNRTASHGVGMTASGTFSVEGVNSTTCKEPPSCRSYPPFVPFVETVGLSSTPSLRLRPRLCVTRSSAQLSRRPALPRASESLTPFAPSWPSAAPVWAQGASSPGHSAHFALPRPGPRRGDRDSWVDRRRQPSAGGGIGA